MINSLIIIFSVLAINVTASAENKADLKPSDVTTLSINIQASRSAISGFPDYFMSAEGVTVRNIWTTDCASLNGITMCRVYASNLQGKNAISILVEKTINGDFTPKSLRFEKDIL